MVSSRFVSGQSTVNPLRSVEMYAVFRVGEESGMETMKVRLKDGSEETASKLNHLGTILPSDSSWRTENYFRLVELHRSKTDTHRKVSKTIPKKIFQKGFPVLGLWALKASERKILKSPELTIDTEPVIHWVDRELITANQVLSSKEYTMYFRDRNPDRTRRIIGLVYDVLRYKNVLGEVLDDIGYFSKYKDDEAVKIKVFLLLYDMICRGFCERKEEMCKTDREDFSKEGLDDIHRRLWENKIQIAATVARIRIRKQAQSLADLLPRRIRQPSKIVSNPIVQGWINIYRIPCEEIGTRFQRLGLSRHVGKEALPPLTFSEDHLLPFHYFCRPFSRSTFLNSPVVKNKEFIIQSRTHCFSAALITEVMKTNELVGSVAQTDVVALPASGYIAALLWMNQQLSSQLIVFGAGDKKELYDAYFKKVGVSNVYVMSESFCEMDPKDPRLEGVAMVLVCPPSSNSSILDPVDLSISRGGDICILRDLTGKTDLDSQPDPVITERQRDTLQRALSIPQVQGVVYETYSEFISENSLLVKSVVDEMNSWAAYKHYKETLQEAMEEMDLPVEEELPEKEIHVPVCDLFELTCLPDICPHEKNCLELENEGVYIGLVMRKKITRLDSKFMISMAEERGLFGSKNKETNRDLQKVISEERPSSSTERRLPRTRINTKRITSHTFCSKLKHISESKLSRCERSRIARQLTISKIWWNALLGHIRFTLRKRLCRLKFYLPRRNLFYCRRKKRVFKMATPEIKLLSESEEETSSI